MKIFETTIATTALAIVALAATGTVMAQGYGIEQSARAYLKVDANLPSGELWELHLVETTDVIYVPIGQRRP